MWLGTLRHKNVLRCVAHVQHDYLSSFNQSDHCFLSLSLLKLPGFLGTVTATVNPALQNNDIKELKHATFF